MERDEMSASIVIIGNATADAELKQTSGGKQVTSFTVAVNDRVRGDDGNWTDGEAAFYRISAWDPIAEGAAEQVKKGTRVIISGKFKPRSFDGNDGATKISLDIRADEIGISTGLKKAKPAAPQDDGSDIPF